MKNRLIFTFFCVLFLGSLMFLAASLYVGFEVKLQCYEVTHGSNQNCVSSLISVVNDHSQPVASHQNAIWALGQIGDPTALPYLKKIVEDSSDQTEQYLLQKAIRQIETKFNPSGYIWKIFLSVS